MKSEHIQKVLVVSPYYPPHIGGLQMHAEEFNHHLAARDYNIMVVTSHLPRTTPRLETVTASITIVRFPIWEIIGNYPLPAVWSPHFWTAAQRVRHNQPDIVISRTRFFITSLLALSLAKYYRVPLIHIEHGSNFVHLSNPIVRAIARLYDLTLGRLVLRRAHTVVANSLASQKFVARLSGRTDTTTIYRGVNKDAFAAIVPDVTLRQRYPNKLLLTYIGRLIDGKGLPILFQALLNLQDSDFHALIIGDGPSRRSLERLVQAAGLGPSVTFYGNQSWAQAMAYLKSADVYINPSYTEGLPTGVIEAALAQKLIIATNVGGTSEIIMPEESGLLVQAGSVTELVTALQRSKNEELRFRLGHSAAASVAGRFNWDHNITMYHELIQKVHQQS